MPHSHNDPGWLWTFDVYHSARTHDMFENLVSCAVHCGYDELIVHCGYDELT